MATPLVKHPRPMAGVIVCVTASSAIPDRKLTSVDFANQPQVVAADVSALRAAIEKIG